MDILLEFLLILLELLLEAGLELAGEAVLDLAGRAVLEVFDVSESRNPVLVGTGYLLLGFLTGGISVLIVPHPLMHRSRVHGISLLISPVITGTVMWMVGSWLRKRGKRVVQIEGFWYGFVFALAMALMRLWSRRLEAFL